jgi:hypothetical protein
VGEEEVAKGGGAPSAGGRRRSVPTSMKSGLARSLNAASSSVVRPNWAAMAPSVSPGWTVYSVMVGVAVG